MYEADISRSICAVGVYVAYFLVAYCYFGVTFSGYAAFGRNTASQILNSVSSLTLASCFARYTSQFLQKRLLHLLGDGQNAGFTFWVPKGLVSQEESACL